VKAERILRRIAHINKKEVLTLTQAVMTDDVLKTDEKKQKNNNFMQHIITQRAWLDGYISIPRTVPVHIYCKREDLLTSFRLLRVNNFDG
jgi:hypothetical protein